MPESNVAFIPANYDRYLGPIHFEHDADDLPAGCPSVTASGSWKSRPPPGS